MTPPEILSGANLKPELHLQPQPAARLHLVEALDPEQLYTAGQAGLDLDAGARKRQEPGEKFNQRGVAFPSTAGARNFMRTPSPISPTTQSFGAPGVTLTFRIDSIIAFLR